MVLLELSQRPSNVIVEIVTRGGCRNDKGQTSL